MNRQNEINVIGYTIRTVIIEDELFFIGKDVAEALRYTNVDKAVKDLVDESSKLAVTYITDVPLKDNPNKGLTAIDIRGVNSLIKHKGDAHSRAFKLVLYGSEINTLHAPQSDDDIRAKEVRGMKSLWEEPIKGYHVKTYEDCKALMIKLEEEDYRWRRSGGQLTHNPYIWYRYEEGSVIFIYEGKRVIFSEIEYAERGGYDVEVYEAVNSSEEVTQAKVSENYSVKTINDLLVTISEMLQEGEVEITIKRGNK